MSYRYKIIIILAALFICTMSILGACKLYFSNNQFLPDADIEYFMSQTMIEIYVIPETVNRSGFYARLINNTNYSFYYGHAFDLYIRNRNRWVYIEPIPHFTTFVEFRIPANSYVVRFILLGHHFETLPSGEYAVVKEVFSSGAPEITLKIVGLFVL